MKTKNEAIGIDQHIQDFKSLLSELEKGKGSIMTVVGESGFGKSYLMNSFLEYTARSETSAIGLHIMSQYPVGNMKLGGMQPLLPFSKAIDDIINKRYINPQKKLAMNMGLTLLTAVPIIGDAFYAAKELGRDWRQFKKDKSSIIAGKINSVTADYYDTFCSYADKTPIVLMMDDMHLCDSHSVELLNLFAETIKKVPILFVISFKQSALDKEASPLTQFISRSNKKISYKIILKEFTKSQITDCCKKNLNNYSTNKQFDTWLSEHTYGVPATVMEYIRYFNRIGLFDTSGKLTADLNKGDFLPASAQSAFSQLVGELDEEERNLLAICSAEGHEFTVTLVSNLLNTDVLTTIKKLRALQNKLGIIKSLGARYKYGAKTTVYRFTQAFYHTFFENSLEYEEYQALHGQIASFLQEKYNDSDSPEVKDEIAPYLAAHSSASGDEETAKNMVLISAKGSEKYGNPDVIKFAYENYQGIETNSFDYDVNREDDDIDIPAESPFGKIMSHAEQISEKEVDDNSTSAEKNTTNYISFDDFGQARNTVVMHFSKEEYSEAIGTAQTYLDQTENVPYDELILLYSLIARSYIALDEFDSAEEYLAKATNELQEEDFQSDCFILNTYGILYSKIGNKQKALQYLKRAGQKAVNLPMELRLLTLSNIGLIIKEFDPEKAKRFLDTSAKISKAINFNIFEKDIH